MNTIMFGYSLLDCREGALFIFSFITEYALQYYKILRMKIAIPTVDQRITPHFGHCQNFAIVHVEENTIKKVEYVDPPMHQPGVYPRFLAGLDVNVIIAGGMGHKAQDLFHQNNIDVIIGIEGGTPEELASHFLNDQLSSGKNLCDH